MNTDIRPYLLFDLGNVLIDLDIPATYRALQHLTAGKGDAFARFLEEQDWLHAYETGLISDDQFLTEILPFTPPGTDADTLRDAWNAMLIGIPAKRLAWLEGLRHDFRVGLLSNTNGIHLAWVYRHLEEVHGVWNFEERYFDHVFYSHHIGAKKPDVACFEMVLDSLNIAAEHILFVDDLEENVRAADSRGMQAVVHPAGEEIMDRLPVYLMAHGWPFP